MPGLTWCRGRGRGQRTRPGRGGCVAGESAGEGEGLVECEGGGGVRGGEKGGLAYAGGITWRLESSGALWERLYQHFSEPELVELGCFIALTMGQQSWLRLLDIEHHEVMPGTAASLAPGFGTPEALAASKASEGYWANPTAT